VNTRVQTWIGTFTEIVLAPSISAQGVHRNGHHGIRDRLPHDETALTEQEDLPTRARSVQRQFAW